MQNIADALMADAPVIEIASYTLHERPPRQILIDESPATRSW